MKSWGILALAVLMLPAAANAQSTESTPNPITSLLKQQVVRYGKLQVEAAEDMPASKYTYRTTPQTRTFGELIVHVTQFNENICARVSGMTGPDIKDLKDTDSKEALVAAIKGSFDFCTKALNGLDDSTLGLPAGKLGPNMLTRGGAIVILGEDWFDHYGTMAIYLRLNGILPPSARQSGMKDMKGMKGMKGM